MKGLVEGGVLRQEYANPIYAVTYENAQASREAVTNA